MRIMVKLVSVIVLVSPNASVASDPNLDQGLIGQWPEINKPREILAPDAPRLGRGDFTITMWANSDAAGDRVPGDLISQYDPDTNRGFHLSLKTNAGVTSNQPNWRHLQFGIDDDRASSWSDCGRPGESLFAFSLATHQGALYAGTCEPGENQSGHVYRHGGSQQWVDCGTPDQSNSVTALAVYQGQLYAGTGKYRVAGSSLPESENLSWGGRIFRYNGGSRWTDCGQLSETEAIGGLVVFRGRLYASSLYHPPGFFVYEKDQTWTKLPAPHGPDRETGVISPKRIESLTVHEGHLYAGSYDGGHVYRFDGESWTDCGQLGDNTQTYAFASYLGGLHVATWPSGRVYRFDGVGQWTDTGRLGEELEVMGMLVHNGRFLAGTLPLAEVYSHERQGEWKRLARLDHTPDVKYRRAWTMAEHDGRVFCSTLPSGRIYSFSAGRQAQWGHSFPPGWQHIAAVRSDSKLELYFNGKRVAQTPEFEASNYQLDTNAPLKLGSGVNGDFNGQIRDARLYNRILNDTEIELLSRQRDGLSR